MITEHQPFKEMYPEKLEIRACKIAELRVQYDRSPNTAHINLLASTMQKIC